jgi:hydrogenase maturation protease
MAEPRILVAGVGNIFMGDDGFGVEVVRRLADRPMPAGVRVVDFGIRGLDLTYALLDAYDAVILVDAVPRGEPPGTLYVLEPEPAEDSGDMPAMEGHNLDPAKVLRFAAALGGRVKRMLVVGCEPEPLAEADDMRMGLSEAVGAAVDEAVAMVESLVADIIAKPQAA